MADKTPPTQNPAGNLKVEFKLGATSGRPVEFGRFEDLARKIAKVPKAEVDAKRREARRDR